MQSTKISFSKLGLEIKPAVKPDTLMQVTDKIILLFDNSGSMGESYKTSTRDAMARLGVKEFILKKSNTTALRLQPLNIKDSFETIREELYLLDKIRLLIKLDAIEVFGSTPFWASLYASLRLKPSRIIVFTDGSPTDSGSVSELVKYNIPIDTVYIGPDSKIARNLLREISQKTNGIFMAFEDMEAFKKAFTFLLPEHRAQLMLPGKIEELGGKK